MVIKWEPYTGAASYFLDIRIVNNTNVVPIVLSLQATVTEKTVQGLRPGTEYIVTFKVFKFLFSAVCVTSTTVWTGRPKEGNS